MLKISNGVVMSRVYLTGNNDTGNDILSLDVAVYGFKHSAQGLPTKKQLIPYRPRLSPFCFFSANVNRISI